MRFLFTILIVAAGLTSCKSEIDKICEPTKTRMFNVVYNAHFNGEFSVNNTCSDTAIVYITDLEGDPLPPGNNRTYQIDRGLQYLVVANCSDSTIAYNYMNECP